MSKCPTHILQEALIYVVIEVGESHFLLKWFANIILIKLQLIAASFHGIFETKQLHCTGKCSFNDNTIQLLLPHGSASK